MVDGRAQRFALISDLNAEWAQLSERHDEFAHEWSARHTVLAGCQGLPDILADVRSDPDAVFSALLTEAAAGETIAARVVLQAMLGKVVRLAQAHPDIGVDEFVSALWCRIRTYPLARRPTRIAANLALDTRKDALAGTRGRGHESSVGSLSEPGWEQLLHRRARREPLEHADEEGLVEARRVLDAARAIGLIDATTTSVLQTVYLDGATSQVAALWHDITPATVRYRCSQALRRMAQHAAAISAAA